MGFTYLVREPTGLLRRYVAEVWFARGHITGTGERITPTGSTVAALVLGPPILQTPDGGGAPFLATTSFLIGPHDRPLLNVPTGETHCVGIVTTPVGCRAVLGALPATVRGVVVGLEEGWPGAGDLRRRLLDSPDGDAMIDVVLGTLAARAPEPSADVLRCEAAVAALEADPTQPIAQVAAELGISHGHLDREFARIVGLGPRTLARILRLRRLLTAIDVFGPLAWAELAAELGWYDQAHLIRDFTRHTGVTPAAYAAAQRRGYSPDDAAPGFVPSGDV